jgi:putative flippase GtrA
MKKTPDRTNGFTTKNKTWWQFIKFTLFSMLTTVVDLGTFSLFNYWIFTRYAGTEFRLWLFDYSLANGGLCAFFSFALSFLQRKATFGATNNVLFSGIMYAVMVLVVFFFQMWLPTLVREPLVVLVGGNWADIILKNLNMTLSFAIQFPMNKWVIMRESKSKKNEESTENNAK